MIGAAERRGFRKWEWGRYTFTQLLHALAEPKADDPHAGNVPIGSLAELDAMDFD